MKRVSNSDLMQVLMNMREDLGGIRARLEDHTSAFVKHVSDDELLAESVKKLQLAAERQAGRASVWTLLYTGISGAIGAAVEYFASRHP